MAKTDDDRERSSPGPSGRRVADYDAAIEHFDKTLSRLAVRSSRISWLRLLSFAAFAAGLVGATSSAVYPLAISLPSLAVFLDAIFRHGRLHDLRTSVENNRLLVVETRERLTSRRSRTEAPPPPASPDLPLEQGLRLYAPEGAVFEVDDGFADDFNLLDGPRSLFGFLNVSSTIFGARRLRYLLTHPLASVQDILTRQEAIRELADKTLSHVALLKSLLPLRQYSFDDAPRWLRFPTAFAGRFGLLLTTNILGTAPLVLIVLAALGAWILLPVIFLLVIVNLTAIGFHVKDSNPARNRLLLFGPLLRGLLEFGATLEKARLHSAEWRELHVVLRGVRPSARRLRRVIGLLELNSYGPIFELFNILTLWELRLLPVAERILQGHREELEHAIGALGEAEALLSLACPLAEQEGYSLPEPLPGDEPRIEAEEVGHPLIESERLVRSPINLNRSSNVWIITGSNLAGKSTYLKAVATNAVLAGAGGPVCGRGFRWTPLALRSDVNVRDSLDNGKSYFQVEVERVLEIVRAARSDPKMLVLFDELFRGTNSEERHAIARAILRYLRSCGALVLAATHDLGLTRLATQDLEQGMANYHLREDVSGQTMTFDYRLREGPAPTRNAIRVLEASGYPEEIVTDARGER